MSFGEQVVTFVTVTSTGQPGRGGLKEKTKTETAVSGCHMRPFTTSEIDGQTDVATEIWKCTAPPVAAALAAKPSDEVKHAGLTFQVHGPIQPKYDLDGLIEHVTVMCKRQM